MRDFTSPRPGTALISVGCLLVVFGAVWTLFGARAADLEACSPSSRSCEAALATQQFFGAFVGLNGVCIVVGLVLVTIGLILRRRAQT